MKHLDQEEPTELTGSADGRGLILRYKSGVDCILHGIFCRLSWR